MDCLIAADQYVSIRIRKAPINLFTPRMLVVLYASNKCFEMAQHRMYKSPV